MLKSINKLAFALVVLALVVLVSGCGANKPSVTNDSDKSANEDNSDISNITEEGVDTKDAVDEEYIFDDGVTLENCLNTCKLFERDEAKLQLNTCKDACYCVEAGKTNNLDICNGKLSGEQNTFTKGICYGYVALKRKDINLCDQITDNQDRQYCILTYQANVN